MKKLYNVVVATGVAIALSGCVSNEPSISEMNLNEKQLCASSNGVASLLETAAKYNKIAKEHKVEFKRLGMSNTQYIDETNKAIAAGEKTVTLLDAKGKPTKNKVTVEYAAERACKFAVSALSQEADGKKTWRDAVPGDGFKY